MTTRRLAAILMADIVGYSRLMHADEERTHAAFSAMMKTTVEPAVHRHGGRLVKSTGDGFLAEFPSAVEAVRSALQFQRDIARSASDNPPEQRLAFRVGINMGDVIVEANDIFGDGVNVAARLEALAEPGGIVISGVVYENVRGRVSCAFEDMGDQTVKNIAKPVRTYRASWESGSLRAPEQTPTLPGKPSLAVLPFDNLSMDPEQEYFSDGLADDLITELSRNTSLFVISRHSSFSFRGQSIDVKQVARELGVRYVVGGSVRQVTNRVRVNANLIDAESGNHIWAERYDRALEDVFAVQDEIVQAVTTAINPIVDDVEQRRAVRKHPESLSAWEAYQRGRSHMGKFDPADNAQAKVFLQRAISIDPGFVPAYSALALASFFEGSQFAILPLEEASREARLWAQRAVDIDPADGDAQAVLAMASFWMGDRQAASERASRILGCSQLSPWSLGILAGPSLMTGPAARDLLFTAMRRSPRDPLTPTFMRHVAMSYYFEHDFARAATTAKSAAALQPGNSMHYRWLAASLGQLGQIQEAREALQQAISLSPGNFDTYVRKRPAWFRPEDHELMLDGLRKAGWNG